MLIIVDCDIPFIRGVLEPYADVCYIKGCDIDANVVKDADALIVRTRTRCDRALLNHSKVKFIATATIGTDHIDLDYCQMAGIEVRNAKGCNARGVLQWVAAALNHIVASDGKQPCDYAIGIVGVGAVGSLVSEYCQHWGFRVYECDPPRQRREGGNFHTIEELATRCDILTFHTPLDKTTHHLVNEELIAMMPPHTTILNASRGAVVDGSALVNSSHRYLFDVWENEPNINPLVLKHSTIATPHVAGYSLQGKANATALSIRALSEYFNLPLNDWYPSEVTPCKVAKIDWREMQDSIEQYYPISEESNRLKRNPERFEELRNGYNYREEYF